MDFEHNHGEVPEYLAQLMSQGAQQDRQLQSGALALCRATLLVSKPSALREASEAGGKGESKAALMGEVQRSMQQLYQKVRDAAVDGSSEAVTPSPDVTGAEWEACKLELQGLHEPQFTSAQVLKSWLKWLRKVLEVRETKAGLLAKRGAAKQAKEQLTAIHASLDAAGRDSPFSLALMHTVAQAARDQAVPLSREKLLWVLGRAKGDERVAISLAISQARCNLIAQTCISRHPPPPPSTSLHLPPPPAISRHLPPSRRRAPGARCPC